MSTELDDDEVLVYDWRNAGIPRPAGTTRLGDGGSYSNQSLWNGWVASQSPAFQSNQVGIQNQHYSTTGTGNWYDQMTAHQMQFGYPLPYNGQYQAMYGHSLPAMSYPTYGNPPPSPYYNNGGYGYNYANYYSDQGRASQGPLDNQVAAKKPKKKVVEESQDNELFDVEEFDYSDSKYRTPEAKSTKSNEASKSKDKARSPAKDVNKSRNETKSPTDKSFQVDEIDYSIPLPTVPLNEILPGFGSRVKSPPKGASQISRKRPRTDIETELIDLMSKKGGRASARSYAKPSRKASTPTTPPAVPSFPTPASSVSSVANEDLQYASGPGPTSRVTFPFSSASPLPRKPESPDKSTRQPTPEHDQTLSSPSDVSANQSFEEVSPTIIDTSLHDVEFDSESEGMEFQIKIRSDIFEDEDDED